MPQQTLAIVGTGLIGTSVGLAAKRAGGWTVAGWDPDANALDGAGERGAIDLAAFHQQLNVAVRVGEHVLDAEPLAP